MNLSDAVRLTSLVNAAQRNGKVRRLFERGESTSPEVVKEGTVTRLVEMDENGNPLNFPHQDTDVLTLFVEVKTAWHTLYWPVVDVLEGMKRDLCVFVYDN